MISTAATSLRDAPVPLNSRIGAGPPLTAQPLKAVEISASVYTAALNLPTVATSLCGKLLTGVSNFMPTRSPRYSRFLILPVILSIVSQSASAKIIFKVDFETGDLSQWSTTGIRGQNATPRNVQVVT